jgi:hypothetical protein
VIHKPTLNRHYPWYDHKTNVPTNTCVTYNTYWPMLSNIWSLLCHMPYTDPSQKELLIWPYNNKVTDIGLGDKQQELINGNWLPYWSCFISSVSQNATACWFGLRGISLLIQSTVHDNWPWTCNKSNTKNLHILIL